MKLRFHRSQKMSVKIQKPGNVRAFVFEVQVGIGKKEPSIDPLSGMLLNLVQVDEILRSLKSFWEGRPWGSLADLLAESQSFLQNRLQKEGVFLDEVVLNESRQCWLSWRSGHILMGQEEVREIEGDLYRLRWNSFFEESQWQQQKLLVNSISAFDGPVFFTHNPQLFDFEFEHLASGEKWCFRKV